jgi:hypothetical protein
MLRRLTPMTILTVEFGGRAFGPAPLAKSLIFRSRQGDSVIRADIDG